MKVFFLHILLISILIPFFANSQCYQPGQLVHGAWLHPSSGNPNIDNVVFSELQRLESFFKFRIDFFFGEEASLNGSTAFFSPTCEFNQYCIGTIVLGFNMMKEKYLKYGDDYIHIVRGILAHEFGHGVQKLKGWQINSKHQELHADFLAGYYISKTSNYSDEMIDKFLFEFYSSGGSYSHGTKEERFCAFREGYNFGKKSNVSVESADEYAVKYVMANNPCLKKANPSKNGENYYIVTSPFGAVKCKSVVYYYPYGKFNFRTTEKTRVVFSTTDKNVRYAVFNKKDILGEFNGINSLEINLPSKGIYNLQVYTIVIKRNGKKKYKKLKWDLSLGEKCTIDHVGSYRIKLSDEKFNISI
jgi:hypothetical protein